MGARQATLFILFLLAGCARLEAPGEPRPVAGGMRPAVAVLPFRTGGTLGAGAGFQPGTTPVEADAGPAVARALTDALAARGFQVVGADATAGAFARADTGAYDPAAAARVGGTLGADLVVLGALTRYRQRGGSNWAAESPASVAYEAVLVRVADGTVLRRDGFDWTQQALTENLLQLPRFLEGGGRWVTREEMLDGALRRTADRFAAAVAVVPPS